MDAALVRHFTNGRASVMLASVANVSLSLLGGFAAAVDGVPVAESAWRLKKARELVKLLALAPGHRLHREQAMELLWGDREPDAASNNLNQAVYVARRALDTGSIEVRDEMLVLVADVDIDRLALAAARLGTSGRLARTVPRCRSTRASCCPRIATTIGRRSGARSSRSWPPSSRSELAALGPDGPIAAALLPAEASSFIGRERELAELQVLCSAARACSPSSGRAVRARRGWRSSWPAAPRARIPTARRFVALADLADAALVPDAVAAALDVRALSGQNPVDAVVEFLGAAFVAARWWTTASTCSRRPPRLSTLCCGLRRGSRSSRRAASRCACPARSCSGSRHSAFRIPSARWR